MRRSVSIETKRLLPQSLPPNIEQIKQKTDCELQASKDKQMRKSMLVAPNCSVNNITMNSSNRIKYPTESALENHYLQSILPHEAFRENQQFVKNKDFYQPEQFIWNNPHRTSQQMYKFYHLYNDKFAKEKQLQLEQLQEQDRRIQEQLRINKVNNMRSQIRQNFQCKQREREDLEARCRNSSQPVGTRSGTHQTLPVNYATQQRKDEEGTNGRSKLTQLSTRVARIENTYQEGLHKYDTRKEVVGQLIAQQTEEYRNKLRQEFKQRKNINESTKIANLGVHSRKISSQK